MKTRFLLGEHLKEGGGEGDERASLLSRSSMMDQASRRRRWGELLVEWSEGRFDMRGFVCQVFAGVFQCALLWMMTGAYVGSLVVCSQMKCPELSLFSSAIPPVARESLIGLLVGFYINHVFDRMFSLYFLIKSAAGASFDLVCLARSAGIKKKDPELLHDLWRFSNVAHMLGHVQRGEDLYAWSNYFIPISESFGELECGMLSKEEQAHIKSLKPGQAYLYYVQRAYVVIQKMAKKGYFAPPLHAKHLEFLDGMVGKLGRLNHTSKKQIPIEYHFFLKALVYFSATLESAQSGAALLLARAQTDAAVDVIETVLMVTLFVLLTFCLSGIMSVVDAMRTPFGQSHVHIPVISITVIGATDSAEALINDDEYIDIPDESVEA